MDPILTKHLSFHNRVQQGREFVLLLIRLIRGLMLAMVVMGVWASIKPLAQNEQFIIGILSLIFFWSLSLRWRQRQVTSDELLKSLEINHPESKVSAFSLKAEEAQNDSWLPLIEQDQDKLLKSNLELIAVKATTLVLPFMMWFGVSELSPGAMSTAMNSMQKVVAQFTSGSTLKIVEGLSEATAQEVYSLSSSETHEITLLEQNRVEITVVSPASEKPYVTLKPNHSSVAQTFRLTSNKNDDLMDAQSVHKIAFNVRESSELFVSTLSTTTPAAKIKVLRLPVPQVSLKINAPKQDPWPDEQPLPLEIRVSAENPLQLIRLQILSEGQTHTELVSNILAQDKTEVTTNYSLLLENYVQKDMATIEIVAEALDRHLPSPLLGKSEPLIIRTASAYGRYRETLDTLKKVKEAIDQALSDQQDNLDPAIQEMMFKAQQQAETSPFFDGLDRHTIRSQVTNLQELTEEMNREQLYSTSEKLNQFLFEHESLDDRERDRDFFVAARSLSRLVEQKKKDRQIAVPVVTERLKKFLDERHQRWELRMKYIQKQHAPELWAEVQNKPFHKQLDQIAQDSVTDAGTQNALQTLSQTVSDYRTWIESLEKAEEASRQQQEQKRQKGLADSRQQLRDLQKRQGKISQKLDRAIKRSREEMSDQWGSMRMDQNANIKETKSLEAKLRSLSPIAAERIQAALKSMQMTLEAGNKQAFVQAESASDLAGRLLRQADNAARRSQKKEMRRGRRRRVTSDQYYGSSVAGGDVEIRREYEVNRRYREDILDEVRRASSAEGRDQELLENYLRKVIR